MKTSEALKIIGGSLSKPSKMPGWSIGLPAKECKTGGKLQKVPGSVCYDCYALKGCYVFKVVQDAQYRRLAAIKKRHWLPTREAWIKNYLYHKPDNLVIRFSAPMVDQRAPASWPNSSSVITKDHPWFGATSRSCPAPKQNNECKDCRACWDPEIKNISYWAH
jgi:hypothetical protein